MPRKRDASKPRIVSDLYAVGFCEVINGVWFSRLPNGKRQSTKIRAAVSVDDDGKVTIPPRQRSEVLRILNKRVAAYMNGTEASTVSVASPRSTLGLYNEFTEARFPPKDDRSAPQARRILLRSATRAYLEPPVPLDADRLKAHLVKRNRDLAATLSDQTRDDYLQGLRRMFDYAVREGYLPRNPVRALQLERPEKRNVPGFREPEMRQLLRYFAGAHPKSPQLVNPRARDTRELYLLYRLQSLTGARLGELVGTVDRAPQFDDDDKLLRSRKMYALQRCYVKPDGFWIMGKGGYPRRFPTVIPPELARRAEQGEPLARLRVAWLRQVRAIIDELVSRPARRNGALFSRSTHRCQILLSEAREAVGLDATDDRGSHSIRKFAIWYHRQRLRLSPEIRADLVGHSIVVAAKFYDEQRTFIEQAEEIYLSTNHAPPDPNKTNG